jgi:hypothetical protein
MLDLTKTLPASDDIPYLCFGDCSGIATLIEDGWRWTMDVRLAEWTFQMLSRILLKAVLGVADFDIVDVDVGRQLSDIRMIIKQLWFGKMVSAPTMIFLSILYRLVSYTARVRLEQRARCSAPSILSSKVYT